MCFNSRQEPERAVEAVAKDSEGVHESVDEGVTTKRSTINNVYENAYVSLEEAVLAMCDNRTSQFNNKTDEEYHLHVITHQALINEGVQHSEESAQNVNGQRATTFKKYKPNASASDQTNNVHVASRPQGASEEIEEETKF